MLFNRDLTHRFDEALPSSPAGVAVLLNANPKQVNAGVKRALSSVLADEHLYFSTSPDDAARIAEKVVARR